MLVNGKPRYWIGWYDRWHLLLPIAIGLLVSWLVMRPQAVERTLPMQVDGAGGAGNGERTAIQPVIAVPRTPEQVPLTPSIIDTPLTGSRFKNDVPVELKGRAHPGSLVTLFYRFEDLPEEALVEAWTDEEGRFRFQLQGFGAGRYQFRIQARTADGRQQVSLPAEYLFVRPR